MRAPPHSRYGPLMFAPCALTFSSLVDAEIVHCGAVRGEAFDFVPVKVQHVHHSPIRSETLESGRERENITRENTMNRKRELMSSALLLKLRWIEMCALPGISHAQS